MAINKRNSDTSIRIGLVRFSYVNVFAPRKDNNGKEKYSVCVIIDKNNKEALDLIRDTIANVKAIGKSSKWDGKIPANLKEPLRDGGIDREDDPAFAHSYFLNCNTEQKPGVGVLVNGKNQAAFDSEDFYSGCYGAVTLNFYPYNSNGNRGVGVGLQNVTKLRDGERLSGGAQSLEQSFGDLEDEDLSIY